MKRSHATDAVRMAASELDDVIGSMKNTPHADFMGTSSAKPSAKDKLLNSASPDIQAMRGLFPDHFVARVARANREK